jgi:hypothetical protein
LAKGSARIEQEFKFRWSVAADNPDSQFAASGPHRRTKVELVYILVASQRQTNKRAR